MQLFANVPFFAASWAHTHPFHPDATPTRTSFARFTGLRLGGASADGAFTDHSEEHDSELEHTTSSATTPLHAQSRFPIELERALRPSVPFRGLTDQDFPPLSNKLPKHVDGVWAKAPKSQDAK